MVAVTALTESADGRRYRISLNNGLGGIKRRQIVTSRQVAASDRKTSDWGCHHRAIPAHHPTNVPSQGNKYRNPAFAGLYNVRVTADSSRCRRRREKANSRHTSSKLFFHAVIP